MLQNSVKLATEPPQGVKAHLTRFYDNITQDFIDECGKPDVWRKLLFNFAFFHAVIQERRRFGKLGWNVNYEFNDADFDTSTSMLRTFLDSPDDVPWDALALMIGHVNYGGKVTDENDRRRLLALFNRHCQEACLEDSDRFTPSGLYYAPEDPDEAEGTPQGISVYRDYIAELPTEDDPEVYGLHMNAFLIQERLQSEQLLANVLALQPVLESKDAERNEADVVLEK